MQSQSTKQAKMPEQTQVNQNPTVSTTNAKAHNDHSAYFSANAKAVDADIEEEVFKARQLVTNIEKEPVKKQTY